MMTLIRKNDTKLASKQKHLRDLKEAKRVEKNQQLAKWAEESSFASEARPPSSQ